MRIIHLESINKWQKNHEHNFIKFCEEEYASQILDVASEIISGENECPIILISGPSGSGKTISSLRLGEMLNALKRPTRVLSLDDYFIPKDDPKNKYDENGEIDYESPDRVDSELLSEDLVQILKCKEITLPKFNFKEQTREKGKSFKRSPSEIVILEGIHALNPKVTGAVGDKSIGIYVSVRTRLKGQGDLLLHPSKIRLLRRFVRDKIFRGRQLSETLSFYANVELGEEKYILPFKDKSDFEIDTFIPYEPCVYKKFVTEDLAKLAVSPNIKFEIDKLFEVISSINQINIDNIPDDSLVREFIGNNKLMVN